MRDGERQQFRLIVTLVFYPLKRLSSSKNIKKYILFCNSVFKSQFSHEHIYLSALYIMKKQRSMKSCFTCFVVAAILQEAFTKSLLSFFFLLNLVLKYVFLKMKIISNQNKLFKFKH